MRNPTPSITPAGVGDVPWFFIVALNNTALPGVGVVGDQDNDVTVKSGFAVLVAKAALTDLALDIASVHVAAAPVQAPPQPENVEPDAGDSVRTTDVPLA
jgi:hypothetical protein